MQKAADIKLFDDLGYREYAGVHVDLHNDFLCTKFEFSNDALLITCVNHDQSTAINYEFRNVKLNKVFLSTASSQEDCETIDLFYRGRAEIEDKLVEINETGQVYFYLDFLDCKKFEFWAEKFSVQVIKT